MTGKGRQRGGQSGGPRPGAGRPVRTFTIQRDVAYLTNEQYPDGSTRPQLARAVEISRTRLVLQFDDGSRLVLIR